MAALHAKMRWLWRRTGRRGISLLFVGLLAFVLALSLVSAPPAQLNQPAYQALNDAAPLPAWATAWFISGLLCWGQAFMPQDRIAFAVSTALWWSYGLAYIVGSFTGVNPRGWVGGMIWIGFGGWLNLIATWPEAADAIRGKTRHAEPR